MLGKLCNLESPLVIVLKKERNELYYKQQPQLTKESLRLMRTNISHLLTKVLQVLLGTKIKSKRWGFKYSKYIVYLLYR